jgi:hypothetical protein
MSCPGTGPRLPGQFTRACDGREPLVQIGILSIGRTEP